MFSKKINPRYRDWYAWDPDEILGPLLESQFCAAGINNTVFSSLARACAAIAERLHQGGRIVYVGPGTANQISVQDAAKLPPRFDWPPDRLVLILADPLVGWVQNPDAGSAAAIAAIEAENIGPEDSLLGLSDPSALPFTLTALQSARRRGALTVSIAHSQDSPLLHAADHPILLAPDRKRDSGPAIPKANSAQKIALNLIAATVMILLKRKGVAWSDDKSVTYQKLNSRAERVLMRLTDAPPSQIKAALTAADGKVNLARLLLEGLRISEAQTLLDTHKGQLRPALMTLYGRKK